MLRAQPHAPWFSRPCKAPRTSAHLASVSRRMQHSNPEASNGSPQPAAAATAVPAPEPIDERACDIPPPHPPLRARVEHLVVPCDDSLLNTMTRMLGVSQEFVEKLVWFGAVYYCPVMPVPGGGKGGVRPPHINETVHSTPRRVADPGMAVHQSGYLRAHVYPKRFPQVYQVSDWRRQVLSMTPHYVAVDKPPGVQVPPTVDNVRESLMAQMEQVLSLPAGSLTPPHRLDAGTQGVVILSRDPGFARHMQRLMEDKSNQYNYPDSQPPQQPVDATAVPADARTMGAATESQPIDSNSEDGSQIALVGSGVTSVRKTYRCVTSHSLGPPPVGRLTHWVRLGVRAAGLPDHTVVLRSREDHPDAKICELIITHVEQVTLSDSAVSLWGCGPRAWQCTIQLLTGRTHQIRAQLAAIGHPLLGDALYTHLTQPAPPSHPTGLETPQAFMNSYDALQPIGLQAWRMEFPADPVYFLPGSTTFTAGSAWWTRTADP